MSKSYLPSEIREKFVLTGKAKMLDGKKRFEAIHRNHSNSVILVDKSYAKDMVKNY